MYREGLIRVIQTDDDCYQIEMTKEQYTIMKTLANNDPKLMFPFYPLVIPKAFRPKYKKLKRDLDENIDYNK